MLAIEIENEETWPTRVLDCFNANTELLSSNANREREILFSPSSIRQTLYNQFGYERDCVIEEVEAIIANCGLAAYHCTRLIDYEVEFIIENGMQLPGLKLLEERLIRANARGLLSREQIDEILTTNEYRNQPTIREGFIHFTCSTSVLKQEGCIDKFFRCWGGEALFNTYEAIPGREVSPIWLALSSLGTPCIIKVSLAKNEISKLAEKLESAYLDNRNIPPAEPAACDAYIRYPLKKEQIIKIITFENREFLELTDYLNWRDQKM